MYITRQDMERLLCPTWSPWSAWSGCHRNDCSRSRHRQCQEAESKMETQSKACGDCQRSEALVSDRSPSLASCSGRCGQTPDPGHRCQCHAWCAGAGSCCHDYQQVCRQSSPSITFPTPTLKPVSHPNIKGESSYFVLHLYFDFYKVEYQTQS